MTCYKTQYKYNQTSFPKPEYECVILAFYLPSVALGYWWNDTLPSGNISLSLLCSMVRGWICVGQLHHSPWIRAKVLLCSHRWARGALFPPQTRNCLSAGWYLCFRYIYLLNRPTYCSSTGEIIWGKFFVLTGVNTSLFITSLNRPGLKMYVCGTAAGSTCGAEQGQQGPTFHKSTCKRREQETVALSVFFVCLLYK